MLSTCALLELNTTRQTPATDERYHSLAGTTENRQEHAGLNRPLMHTRLWHAHKGMLALPQWHAHKGMLALPQWHAHKGMLTLPQWHARTSAMACSQRHAHTSCARMLAKKGSTMACSHFRNARTSAWHARTSAWHARTSAMACSHFRNGMLTKACACALVLTCVWCACLCPDAHVHARR
eukprot:1000378-Alexandrium_andersonii.AAC.2